MINILLSTYDFNNENCFPVVKQFLKPNMKVVILPFSHDDIFYDREDYFDELYDYEFGKDFNILANVFRDYGIGKENIYVLNPFRDTIDFMKMKIQQADVCFAVGGNPITFMQIVKALGLLKVLKNFNGIFIGASAGAMIQVEEFIIYPTPYEDYEFGFYKGLGYIKGKDVIVHWNKEKYQFVACYKSMFDRLILPMFLRDGECIIFEDGIEIE